MSKVEEYTSIQHPDDSSLQNYLRSLEHLSSDVVNDNSAISGHLVDCKSCRQRVDFISKLKTSIELVGNIEVDVDDELDILTSDSSATTDKNSIRNQIMDNPAKLRSALHSLSHRKSMQRKLGDVPGEDQSEQIRPTGTTQREPKPEFGLFEPALLWLRNISFNQSVFASVIAIALLTSLIVSNQKPRVTQFEEIAGLKIISQDSSLPGIGFFNNANVTHQNYAGITIGIEEGNTVEMNWAPIPGVNLYHIKVQRFVNGMSETVSQFETVETEAQLVMDGSFLNVRFEWTLSGEKNDGSAFLARGGFVIDD